jgi:3-keto-disaccharide hydrolase
MHRPHSAPLAAAVAVGVLIAAGLQAQAPNTLTAAETKAGWTLLFDGSTLNGWRGYKKPDTSGSRWIVQDGTLALPSGNGQDTRGARDIITTGTYEHFELSLDWKISEGGNSGIKYFVLEDMDSAIGHEYQVIDDQRHPDAKIGPHRQTGAFYDVLQAHDRPLKPAGEWNTARIVVRGMNVEHWLNGTRILAYTLDSPDLRAAIAKSKFKDVARFGKLQDGHLLLQDHGDQVWYRNIKVRRLDGPSQ